jgi:hypothetical protein
VNTQIEMMEGFENLKIRDDIFLGSKGGKKEIILAELIRLAFEALGNLFSSEDVVIEFVNNFKDPKIAERFLEIATFYYYAQFHFSPNCFTSKRAGNCPECKSPFEMPAHTVLIMILSMMEFLSSDLKEYVDFYDWISKKEIVSKYQHLVNSSDFEGYKKLVESLKKSYKEKYGSRTKITNFFNKNLTNEEKLEFVRSVRYYKEVPDLFTSWFFLLSYSNMSI